MPLIKVSMKAEVVGADSCQVGDILTVKLKVEFLGLEKGQQSGYVHSRTYPFLRRENWYLVITDESMSGLATVEKLPIDEEVFEKEFQEKISRSGPIRFVSILANDSYKGLDQVVKCEVEVMDKDFERKEYQYLPEDLEIVKEEKEEEEETAPNSEDEDAPEIELDSDELIRRLNKAGLSKAANELKVDLDKRSHNLKMKIKEEPNPFVPQLIKTIQQKKQEDETDKNVAEAKKKEELAHKAIMN